jgi:mannosyltransferase
MAARTPLRVEDVDVIAPNFKRRLSGVTSTIVQLVPLQAAMGLRIATLGPGLPGHLPFIRFRDMWRLWKKPRNQAFRVWHARRNVEMIGGLVLRDVLRMPLKLVFTSASQRKHKPFTRFLIRRMDRVVATSTKSAAFLEVPHTVIMHGIDTQKFAPPLDKAAAKYAVSLDPERRHIGCFGRIRHQKGTDLFVEAMIALLPSSASWSAIISGRITPEHEAFAAGLRARIKKAGLEGRIIFVGEVPDILPFYQAIDLYVAPSRNEGFGLTPLEAMACGVPVVTSDAGAYTDLVQPGVNGEICAARHGAELTLAIAKMMAPATELGAMGRNALAFVRQNFALEKEAESLNALYKTLTSRVLQS